MYKYCSILLFSILHFTATGQSRWIVPPDPYVEAKARTQLLKNEVVNTGNKALADGVSYLNDGKYEQAISKFNFSLECFEATNNKKAINYIQIYLALTYGKSGDKSNAFRMIEQSKKGCKGYTCFLIASTYETLKDHKKAFRFYQKSIGGDKYNCMAYTGLERTNNGSNLSKYLKNKTKYCD